MDYKSYKQMQTALEARAESLANKAADTVDNVASEVQAKGQAEYEKAAGLYEDKKPFRYIVIAGAVVLVLAVVVGVFFG